MFHICDNCSRPFEFRPTVLELTIIISRTNLVLECEFFRFHSSRTCVPDPCKNLKNSSRKVLSLFKNYRHELLFKCSRTAQKHFMNVKLDNFSTIIIVLKNCS